MAQAQRLDVELVRRALAPSRSRAQAMIGAGQVLCNNTVCRKAAMPVLPEDELAVMPDEQRFVGRGGFKLLKAIETFHIDLNGAVAMDVGASTGGFTDCMLQHGAARVYAVDVGSGQLDASLRADERVICMENCNARYLTREQIPEPLSVISVDVSFISLTKVVPALVPLLCENGCLVCLIKPQFEAGRAHVGKNGVVRNSAVHVQVINDVVQALTARGLVLTGLTYSPIRGGEGNIEYLAAFAKQTRCSAATPLTPEQVVAAAHETGGVTA